MQADRHPEAGAEGARRPSADRGLAGFEAGLRMLFEGAAFLRREHSLWPLAMAPVFLSLVLVSIAGSYFLGHLGTVVAWCRGWLPVFEAGAAWHWLWVGPATFLVWIAGGLVVVVAFAASIVAALLVANCASAPFLERLSFRVESLASAGDPFIADPALGPVRLALLGLRAELVRTGILAAIAGALFALGALVPGASPFAAAVALLVAVFFLPLVYMGHAFDRRGAALRDRLRFEAAHPAKMAGFGSVAFLACFVPGLNLVLMPALGVAGTLLVVRRDPPTERENVADLVSFSERES